ncbi:hypothetical protein HDF18_26545 [Mucilaginibacter sp. X5P1]|nr:hypothetical protein [Mucilaginibacter sp. X5P1]MBB6138582.1 hypothetical protein [Mucilaginibacter sp. X5P1]
MVRKISSGFPAVIAGSALTLSGFFAGKKSKQALPLAFGLSAMILQ